MLAPTREVALQSADVVQRIAAGLPTPIPAGAAFVGGLPIAEDQKRLRRWVCLTAAAGAMRQPCACLEFDLQGRRAPPGRARQRWVVHACSAWSKT